MAVEKTLSIIKPDAVSKNQIGLINERITSSGLWIVAAKIQQLTVCQAASLYAIHRTRPFFSYLIEFMTSGPILLQVLAGEQAIARYRKLMGSTDPKQALPGTLRADFASSVERNAVHGSENTEAAAYEISLFFSQSEIYPLGLFEINE